jgi:hypothetical protein
MQHRKITTTETTYAGESGHFTSEMVATVVRKDGTWARFGLGGWTAAAKGRLETGGPMVAGPYAYGFGLASCIDNHGGTAAERQRKLAAGTEFDVAEGDILEFDCMPGERFAVALKRSGRDVWLYLERVAAQVPETVRIYRFPAAASTFFTDRILAALRARFGFNTVGLDTVEGDGKYVVIPGDASEATKYQAVAYLDGIVVGFDITLRRLNQEVGQ